MKPRRPGRTRRVISVGNASSGLLISQPPESCSAIIPGITMAKGTSSHSPPAKIIPSCPCSQRPSGQIPLDDELVQPAIVEYHDPHSPSHPCPGQTRVVRRQDHVQLVGVAEAIADQPPPASNPSQDDHPAGQQARDPGTRSAQAIAFSPPHAVYTRPRSVRPAKPPRRSEIPGIARSVTPPGYNTAGNSTDRVDDDGQIAMIAAPPEL